MSLDQLEKDQNLYNPDGSHDDVGGLRADEEGAFDDIQKHYDEKLHPEEAEKIRLLRRVLADMHPVEAMELLVNRSKKTKTNAEFLMTMNLA